MNTQHNYQEQEIANDADIEYSKPSKSRFLFLLFFLGYFIFAWAGCFELYQHKYQSNEGIKAQESSLYEPVYK